jgi:hypothetical protein
MSYGGSLILIAAGALLYWAVNLQTRFVNLHTVGLVLMAVGAVGLLSSLVDAAKTRRQRFT